MINHDPTPMYLTMRDDDRLIITVEDGQLQAAFQREWDGEWVTVGVASKQDSPIHLEVRK